MNAASRCSRLFADYAPPLANSPIGGLLADRQKIIVQSRYQLFYIERRHSINGFKIKAFEQQILRILAHIRCTEPLTLDKNNNREFPDPIESDRFDCITLYSSDIWIPKVHRVWLPLV